MKLPSIARLVLCFVLAISAFHLGTGSPAQYHAQLYTEVLGRSPSPTEWVANEYFFDSTSISVQSLKPFVSSMLQSAEFNQLGYTSVEKAYVLFRAILLREPSHADMAGVASQLERGVSIGAIASDMMDSAEFRQTLDGMIRPLRAHAYKDTGPDPRPTLGSTGIGNVDGHVLQAALDTAAPGSTVFLARGALVRLHHQLVIPSGVTLATLDEGAQDRIHRKRNAYAAMGRLVRARMFIPEMVRVMPGGRIIGVWVDGRRSQFRVNDPLLRDTSLSYYERMVPAHNISLRGGHEGGAVSEVSFCKVSDSSGWTGIHGVGSDGGVAVGYSRIANNLITSYSASKDLEETFFTDGISLATSNAIVVDNEIIDPSDVGIVVFNPGMQNAQRSHLVNNRILFAGISGWGGITLDHSVGIGTLCQEINPEGLYDCFDAGNPAIVADFQHTLVKDNLIWSSDEGSCNVGISLGVHMWGLRMFGRGGQVIANKLGTDRQPLNTGVGIVVSGNLDPIVLENTLHLHLDQSMVSCVSARLLLDPVRTTLGPGAAIQPGFAAGETWATLRPRSNGQIFGNYNLVSATNPGLSMSLASGTSDIRLHDVNQQIPSKDWILVLSERNFHDGRQYHLVVNRVTFQAIEANGGSIRAAPYSGSEQQYWRFESFDGNEPGNGLRLVNRQTGTYLSRDGAGYVVSSTDAASASANWLLQRLETRELDFSQEGPVLMDVFGDVFQIYLSKAKLHDHRILGNPNAEFGIRIFASDNSPVKPLGMLDFNRNGRMDAAFLLQNGSLIVAFTGPDGQRGGANLGNMREVWGWDIHRGLNSWEKPIGFVDLGGTAIEDLIVIDQDGALEVGYLNENGLAGMEKIGFARDIGLAGATSHADSPIKSLGSGDLNGDGKRSLVFVGPAGGLFRVDAGAGRLLSAVFLGNPVETFGWGVTSSSDSAFKPVGFYDVDGDGDDDLVMIAPSGNLVAYMMQNGRPVSGALLGNPNRSWSWNFSSGSNFTRPLAVPYGNGWWGW